MPITANHVFSSPISDGTNTQLVRPSDWNSSHAITLNLSGSEVSQVFTNGGGITFGLSANGYVSATVATNYLTTGALSNHSHGNPTLNLTNISGTTASNSAGFTLSLSAANPGGGGAVNFSAGTTSGNLQSVTFADSNGVFFGLNGSTVTASHNGLTTAMASNRGTDFVQATAAFAGTNASGTIASGGVSISVGNYITTAMASNRGTDFVQAGAVFAGTNASGTIASNGLSVSVGNYITTARASTDAVGLNTAQSNVTWTVNSGGVSFDARGYAGTGTTFGGTNVSASATLNSNGLQLSLSAPTPGGGGAINVTAGGESGNLQTVQFNNANNVSFGLNGSTVTASASFASPKVSYFANVPILNNTTTLTMGQSTSIIAPLIVPEDLTFNYIRLLQSGAVLAASTTAATTGNATFSCGYTKSHNFVIYSRGAGASSGSLQFYFSTQVVENFSNNIACAANSTQFSYSNRYTFPHSTGVVGFTQDYSSSAVSINQNSASATAFSAWKQVDYPMATTLSGGNWWIMYGQSSSTATQSAGTTIGLRNLLTYNLLAVSQNTLQIGTLGAATTNLIGMQLGLGSFTTAGGGTTNSLAFTNITTTAVHNVPYMQLMGIT